MRLAEVYIGFHKPSKGDIWTAFGHVEMWGYTHEDNWLFLDPTRKGIDLRVLHRHDDVEDALALCFERCHEVWRTVPRLELTYPPVAPLICVSVVAHAVGLRAWTPNGLRKRLAATGAVRLPRENPEGRPGGQEGAPA